MRTIKTILVIYLIFNAFAHISAQCPSSKYGIVPVWPQGWSLVDIANWHQLMSDKGMGYYHTILTWPELAAMQANGTLVGYVSYLEQLKIDYGFKYHLLIRNPSTTVNPVPRIYSGLNFEDSELTNAFYDFATAIIDSFGTVLDYLTVGGESDIYFITHPNEMDEYVDLLSRIAGYLNTNQPSTKFATVVTFEHGVQSNDDLWQLTKSFSDMLAITYWPLNGDFTIIPSAIADIEDNMSDLLIAADGKPVVIKESGIPSSTFLGSSEIIQAEFIEELFRQTIHIDEIEIVGWDFLADFNNATVDFFVNFQQIFTPEFRAYFESLGLMDTLANPKPGYSTYLNMLDKVCLQTDLQDIEPNDQLKIYPNPADNLLIVDFPQEFHMEIINVLGKKVLTSKTRQTDISKIETGIYLVLIKSEDGHKMSLERLVKN